MTDEWTEHLDPATGALYYLNSVTGVSSWTKPAFTVPPPPPPPPQQQQHQPIDTAHVPLAPIPDPSTPPPARSKPALSSGEASNHSTCWVVRYDPGTGADYYFNTLTEESSWEVPDNLSGGDSLPDDWEERADASTGLSYFWSESRRRSSWTWHGTTEGECAAADSGGGAAQDTAALADTVDDWEAKVDEDSGLEYYFSKTLQRATWDCPPCLQTRMRDLSAVAEERESYVSARDSAGSAAVTSAALEESAVADSENLGNALENGARIGRGESNGGEEGKPPPDSSADGSSEGGVLSPPPPPTGGGGGAPETPSPRESARFDMRTGAPLNRAARVIAGVEKTAKDVGTPKFDMKTGKPLNDAARKLRGLSPLDADAAGEASASEAGDENEGDEGGGGQAEEEEEDDYDDDEEGAYSDDDDLMTNDGLNDGWEPKPREVFEFIFHSVLSANVVKTRAALRDNPQLSQAMWAHKAAYNRAATKPTWLGGDISLAEDIKSGFKGEGRGLTALEALMGAHELKLGTYLRDSYNGPAEGGKEGEPESEENAGGGANEIRRWEVATASGWGETGTRLQRDQKESKMAELARLLIAFGASPHPHYDPDSLTLTRNYDPEPLLDAAVCASNASMVKALLEGDANANYKLWTPVSVVTGRSKTGSGGSQPVLNKRLAVQKMGVQMLPTRLRTDDRSEPEAMKRDMACTRLLFEHGLTEERALEGMKQLWRMHECSELHQEFLDLAVDLSGFNRSMLFLLDSMGAR